MKPEKKNMHADLEYESEKKAAASISISPHCQVPQQMRIRLGCLEPAALFIFRG